MIIIEEYKDTLPLGCIVQVLADLADGDTSEWYIEEILHGEKYALGGLYKNRKPDPDSGQAWFTRDELHVVEI